MSPSCEVDPWPPVTSALRSPLHILDQSVKVLIEPLVVDRGSRACSAAVMLTRSPASSRNVSAASGAARSAPCRADQFFGSGRGGSVLRTAGGLPELAREV
jgi:hypothetical protein